MFVSVSPGLMKMVTTEYYVSVCIALLDEVDNGKLPCMSVSRFVQ